MKPVINEVFVAKNESLLFPISLAVILTFAIKGLSNYGQSVSISYVGQRIVTDTQHRLYEHLIEMELGFFHRSSTGSLLSRFTVDSNKYFLPEIIFQNLYSSLVMIDFSLFSLNALFPVNIILLIFDLSPRSIS